MLLSQLYFAEEAIVSLTSTMNYTFILAGKFGVGKTAIFNRIKTEEFTDEDNDSNMLLDTGPLSSGSDGELEHQLYRTTINSVKYEVSYHPKVLSYRFIHFCFFQNTNRKCLQLCIVVVILIVKQAVNHIT